MAGFTAELSSNQGIKATRQNVILNILKTKLAAIESAGESAARHDINSFYKAVTFNGSKLRHPPYSEVGGVWLTLIRSIEKEYIAEIKNVLAAMPTLHEDQLYQIEVIVEETLQDDSYTNRLKAFGESVAQKAASYGLTIAVDPCGFNIADAAYQAGVQNTIRAARSNIKTELKAYISKRGIEMGLSSLLTDNVSLLKKDGATVNGIKASVQADEISIIRSDILIQSGDLIQRKMSNGGEETFEVIDPGFHEKFHSIPAGYRMRVKKLGIPESQDVVKAFSINVVGNDSKVNVHSTDNSINVRIDNSEIIQCLHDIRRAIEDANLSNEERKSAKEVVDVVETQVQSGHPSKSVVSTLLKSLPLAANVAVIVAKLLSLI